MTVWKLNHGTLDWEKGPLVMGILNVTPDSFSDGGRYIELSRAVNHVRRMIKQGVDIIDVGGESSRPGADPVSLDEELTRVLPVIKEIRKFSDIPISIDTYKAEVADAALQAGADVVNDISGTEFDLSMPKVIERRGCPVIVMHMQGNPKNMQNDPKYKDVVEEVYNYFKEKIKFLKSLNDGKIILDPGIGFGKTLEHNCALLRNIPRFTGLKYPLLLGVSNKSFLGKWLDIPIEKRNTVSRYTELAAMFKGVSMVRTHDVRETVHARRIFSEFNRQTM